MGNAGRCFQSVASIAIIELITHGMIGSASSNSYGLSVPAVPLGVACVWFLDSRS
jgi:hypothetical protein